jgi:uncharacterized protein (TIGR01777 family)
MRILVTGASGFVGRALCQALAARGDRLVVLLRQPGSAGGLPPGTERVQWDAMTGPPPERALAGVDAIVHLAGETVSQRWTVERKRRIRDSRVLGTRHLIDAVEHRSDRPRTLVNASAIGIYGDRGDETLAEGSPPGNGFLAELCAAWEAEARRAEGLGLRVACLRLGVVLGREGGALPRMLPPFKVGLGGPIGGGEQWMSWIHRDDVVGLVLHALEVASVTGALNATAPEPVRNRDFATTLGRVLSRPAVLPVPAPVLRLVFGEMASVLLGSQRALPERTQASGFRFHHPSLEAALRDILRP